MAVAFLTVPFLARAQAPAPTSPDAATTQPVPPAAPAATHITTLASGPDAVVSMTFDETPIADVIKAFRDATGANIISAGTNLQGTVSVRLDNVPWRKGLTSILDPQGLQLIEQPAGSGIFVVAPKTTEIPKVTRSFDLQYARAEEVTNLIVRTFGSTCNAAAYTAGNVVIITATDAQMGECEKIITSIDKPTPQVYIEVRFAELTASASKKLGMKWDSLGGDGWGVNFDGATLGYSQDSGKTKSRGNTSTSGHSFNSDQKTGNTVDNSGTDVFTTDDGEHISQSSTIGNTVANTMENIVNGSSTTTRNTSRTHSMGRTFSGSLSMDAFTLAMNAFEQIDGVSIFSNPKIMVANEKEATVDMTTKEPNLTVTTTRSGTNGDQIDVAARLEVIPGEKGDKDGKGRGLFAGEAFFSYGISVKVTPRISPTGLITLVVEPSISALKNYYEFTGVGDAPTPRYPIIDMQRMQTIFTMQSGSTAVIGGLTKTTEGNTDSGIPVLRNLPWIGPHVFGWKSREKQQKEIIIFVTVGIADPLDLPQDVGLPKNAILGRDILTGELKEPGDRTKEEVLSLKDPKPSKPKAAKAVKEPKTKVSVKAPEKAPVKVAEKTPQVPVGTVASEREAAQPAKPAVIEPLLKNP